MKKSKAATKPRSPRPAAPPAASLESRARRPERASAAAPPAPERRSTYAEAIGAYERGLEAIQRHEYRQAADILQSVLHQYPDEKELHERVRLYLRVCERHLQPVDGTPRTPLESVYAATLALNSGSYDRAVDLANAALAGDDSLDAAEYILAIALSMRGNLEESLSHLQRAVDLNPDNRDLARRDPDLEVLRRVDEARSFLEAPSSARRDRRPQGNRFRGPTR